MKPFEFNPSQLSLAKIISYALFVGIAFHFFVFFINDVWITELQVRGGPHWNLFEDRNVDGSNPKSIMAFGGSAQVISFHIKTTDSKLYKEPYFILLGIIKLAGYCIWLIVANLLRKVVLDFEKGELFNKTNIKRLTGINGLILIYYLFIHKSFGIVTANLCRKIVFPEKEDWMIRPMDEYLSRPITDNYMLLWIIFTMLIFAIKKGMEIKEEHDLTV
jgi:hypothetical protein